MNKKYDVILIGNTLSTYMCSIYLKTSNLNHLVICMENQEDYLFNGYDKVPGVLNIKDQKDLVHKLKSQAINLKAEIKDEKVIKIGYDDRYEIKDDKFEVHTDNNIYFAKSLILSKNLEINISGVFINYFKILYNEAIELLGNGCKLSFKAREYCSKIDEIKEERMNTKMINY